MAHGSAYYTQRDYSGERPKSGQTALTSFHIIRPKFCLVPLSYVDASASPFVVVGCRSTRPVKRQSSRMFILSLSRLVFAFESSISSICHQRTIDPQTSIQHPQPKAQCFLVCFSFSIIYISQGGAQRSRPPRHE